MKCQSLFYTLALGHASHGFLTRLSEPHGDSRTLSNLKRDEKMNLADAPNWALKNVTRKIPREEEIWMGFHITSEGYHPEWCYMLVHVKGDAKTASFSRKPCVGSNFTVSWGHAEENDGGIITLVNQNETRRSWFGWNHVNDREKLDDVGPNATKEIPS
ncbi:Uncharacterized protein TPAR_02739 [Tolypocladium paradoxum]|uniref:Uncharacterized protein n=1 Tax=Tolypocladium paradoxum TaxID=94208 RepID=A0A2S4L3M2_9HYPO|nr:Uncharacterized protein TPAR_02739 [Tolypocladium paradoxum]